MCWGFRACERDACCFRGGSQGLMLSSIACGVSDGGVGLGGSVGEKFGLFLRKEMCHG